VFARQPLSLGALLEVRAIAAEVNAGLAIISNASSQDESVVAGAIFRRELGALAYDHELVEYTAAFHLLAYRSGISDILKSIRLAARLAFAALNLQEHDFANIQIPEEFSIFGTRNEWFLKNNDRGFAFVCMVWNGGAYLGDEDAYVEGCLSKSNLSNINDLAKRAADALNEPISIDHMNATTFHFVRESLASSFICEEFAGSKDHTLSFATLCSKMKFVCPPFMHSEGEFIELNPGRLAEYRPEEMHDAAQDLRETTYNLLSGCRGFPTS
jgi:hypothetical protein